MSDRDRGAWRSDGVVALRCVVPFCCLLLRLLAGFQVALALLAAAAGAGQTKQYFLIFFQDVQRETKVVFLLYTILIFYSRYTIELCYR
jgi:hypothetical protein